ncbi:uncharacterized protein TNCV_3159581 [Trichonephila clavipes]|nr:uncharacterized protein TNCV_3159581 [Trichonephila clavipes]
MPPNTLRVNTEYMLIKSVGPKILWAESRVQGTGEYFPLLQFHAKIVEVEIGGGTIYRSFGEFRRANSYCHLYGAQGLSQRKPHFYPLATMNFEGLDLTTSDRIPIQRYLTRPHDTSPLPSERGRRRKERVYKVKNLAKVMGSKSANGRENTLYKLIIANIASLISGEDGLVTSTLNPSNNDDKNRLSQI